MREAEWKEFDRQVTARLASSEITDSPNVTTGDIVPLRSEVLRLRKQVRELKADRQNLEYLSKQVSDYLRALDCVVTEPEGYDRGRLIARLGNVLEWANDQVRFFRLGVDCRKDGETRKKVPTLERVMTWLEGMERQQGRGS